MSIDNSNLSLVQKIPEIFGAAGDNTTTQENAILFRQTFAEATFQFQENTSDDSVQVRLLSVGVSVISLFQRHQSTPIPPAAQGIIKTIEELMEKLLEIFGLDLASFREELDEVKAQNLNLDETGQRLLVIAFSAVSIVHKTDSLSPEAAEEASMQLESVEAHLNALQEFLGQLPNLLGEGLGDAFADPQVFAAKLSNQLLDGLINSGSEDSGSNDLDEKGPFGIFAEQIFGG